MDKVTIELSKLFISDISKHKNNHLYNLRHNSQFTSFQFLMADLCDKDLYDLKILETLDYIKSVSKKKPSKKWILKYMTRSNLKLQEEVLKMLLDNLKEEGILENPGDYSNQCFYFREFIENYMKKRQKATEIIDSREDDT